MKYANHLITFLFFILILGILSIKAVYGATTSTVDVKIKLSVCGNIITEDGEDCDNANLNNKSCQNLGYVGGTLSCNISCSFDTSNCTAPSIDPNHIAPSEVPSLLAAEYFTMPPTESFFSTSSLTTTHELTINVPQNNGTSTITVPDSTVITQSDGNNFNPLSLTANDTAPTIVSGLPQNVSPNAVLQWGIVNTELQFSTPISITLFVGSALNGLTLTIVRSESPTEGWTSIGIVAPATCIVTNGFCSFQAVKASYYAVYSIPLVINNTSSNTPSSSQINTSSSSSNSSSCTNQSPSGAPSIYQIDARSNSVQLFFVPAADPVTSYYISYGYQPNNLPYGVEFSQSHSTGAIAFTINALAANATYYFTVRGSNGCMPGKWSNVFAAKTQSSSSKKVTHFYATSQNVSSSPTVLANSASNCSNTYTVQRDDSLWMIAQKLFNKGALFIDLITQNLDRYASLRISTIIHPNWTLNYGCR